MDNEKLISVMKRYELKFRLDAAELAYFEHEIAPFMKQDAYGMTSIASLYFDTPDYQLITKSIEKPAFKEKLRLRSYGLVKENGPTFLEVKRKCEGIVYKRRIKLKESEAMELIARQETCRFDQIGREISFFVSRYGKLEPKYLIIYDRVAYFKEDCDVRITLDRNPRYRTSDLNLHTSMDGMPLIEEGGAILEIKVQHAMPIWLAEILARGHIYQSSFSKVGAAHQKEKARQIMPLLEPNRTYASGGYHYGFAI